MVEEIIKLAIKNINNMSDELQYEFIKGSKSIQPSIDVKTSNGKIDNVVFDVSLIKSVTITNNTLMLYEDKAIIILSPINYTWHQACV